ncbi:type-F conjugative transfer system secretin TraK [Burkholderia glumae]|uniref:type-F conjugative transfer system secretin TraK n=1 Tax=Burkholderia glumae TaxID=337 RepID=UPI00040FD735|nr:type-F conjugative transfer system secretin TraK [Burkholderia glumae]
MSLFISRFVPLRFAGWLSTHLSRNALRVAACMMTGLATPLAHATQHVAGADRQVQQVSISATEFNHLTMGGGRHLSQVVPTVPGSLSYTKDGASLWFKPANPTALNETITIFVTDDAGTAYRLLLVPGARPAEDIRIEPPTRQPDGAHALRASSFVRQIKQLMLAMAGADGAPELDYTRVNQSAPLWKEARLTLDRRYEQDDFVGEAWTLTNTTHADLTLDEREFYAPGVLAIAVQTTNLPPGASAAVYVVRERGEHE